MHNDIVLSVSNLGVCFTTEHRPVQAVDGLSFTLRRGQTLGIVGESGSGKSQSVLALMGLLAANGHVSGRAMFDGVNLLTLSVQRLNLLRGNRIAMIFQDPMTALNPYLRVSRQMTEVVQHHLGMTRQHAREHAIAALSAVHIPDAAQRIDMYPHEFSGGMRQRVMIAMALLCEPDVLIADEPTTALDVTVQAEILVLLRELQARRGTAIIFITHDLGVVASLCDEVVVMYGGKMMERANVYALFNSPLHPYTAGLLASVPKLDEGNERLYSIPGSPPDMSRPQPGCGFAARCSGAGALCQEQAPAFAHTGTRGYACYFPHGVQTMHEIAP